MSRLPITPAPASRDARDVVGAGARPPAGPVRWLDVEQARRYAMTVPPDRTRSILLLAAALAMGFAAGSRNAPDPPAPWRVDLQHAGAAELTLLPGIGPVTAQRIIAWRGSNAMVEDVHDLEAVEGIGPATCRRLASFVRPLGRDEAERGVLGARYDANLPSHDRVDAQDGAAFRRGTPSNRTAGDGR